MTPNMTPDGYLTIDEASPAQESGDSSASPPGVTPPPGPSGGPATLRFANLLAPHRLALAAVTLLSLVLNFYQLGQNGFGNLYYAAAVRSMGSDAHAFFFASLDPAGFVSVDKPPLGFWLQVLSIKMLGFTPFAIFLPQALAGVLSVVLIYALVRRHFGLVAGLIAALALAVSPISVVTNRNNTIDSTLMLALLLGAWAVFRALETDQLRWIVLAGVFVGLGFNIKMLEAYLVVPAFFLAYILGSRKPWVRRICSMLVAGVTMLGLSFAWVIAVDLIPAALRPWVGSTTDNSELTLAIGYNGVQRLLGGGGPGGGNGGGAPGLGPDGRGPGGGSPGGPGGGFPGGGPGGGPFGPGAQGSAGSGATSSAFVPASASGGAGTAAYGPPEGFAGGPGGQGAAGGGTGMFNTGNPGLLRLFTAPLGGQIVWLLPLALIGLVALALDRPFRPREDRQQQSMVLWGTWLLTMAVFFSVAGFFHQYYLSQMAPAIAALVGIGVIVMWRRFVQPGWRGWFLPLALGATALEQLYLVSVDSSWGTWLLPLLGVTVALAVLLACIRLLPQLPRTRSLGLAAVALIFVGLLAAPTVWSAYPAWANTAPDLPIAGIDNGVAGGPPGGASSVSVNSQLIGYLEAHQGSAAYLVAVPSSSESAPIIIATGDAVMTLGGFNGSDPILTTAQLQSLIDDGTVRYFLLSGNGNGGGPGQAASSVTSWVAQNCATVASSAYGGGSSGSTGFGGQGGGTLYDCASQA
ncbi:MAG TPA: glycosyltransferase family 39 protein [Ktedonobacterales bacterium]